MELSLEEITKLTGGRVVAGESKNGYRGLAALNDASASDVSFLGNEKYYNDYLSTKAGLVLVPSVVTEFPDGPVYVEVENPSYAFGLVVKKLSSKMRSFKPGVHPSAYVAEDVKFDSAKVSIKANAVVESGSVIGDGTEIQAGAVIGENVTVGRDCLIYPNVTVREFCELGDRVIIQPGAVIGSDGYGYEFVDGAHQKVDQVGIVVLEDDVEIGANTTIDRARFGKTVIGEGTKIDNLVQIAHNVVTGKHCLVVALTGIAGSSSLGNNVTVAAQVGMAGHIHVGDKAILMSRTGVMKNLEGGQVYWGNPARPVKDQQRSVAAVARLPKLMTDFRELKKKVEQLGSE
ncbi:UDP-3-O-(3-hydroxymyristoyl)glucosamine N-acyltransferase [Rubritalea sp.]|uniref:UDP-3-O-(3-hydroxymyristoyl)glucosamine N-acyltransferase n=1 Tax=Rubritalea sp. TaxID=2109375 RepID=UPI003EF25DC7